MPGSSYSFPLFYLNQGKERQALINSGFDIWQRRVAFKLTPGREYTADRWEVRTPNNTLGAGVEQTMLDPADAPAKVGLTKAMLLYQDASPSQASGMVLDQKIPGVAYGNGGQINLSFWAWSEEYNVIHEIGLLQHFGNAYGSSPDVEVYKLLDIELTPTPTRYNFVLDVPSTAGKNIPTEFEDYLGIWIEFEKQARVEVFITGLQVSLGASPLPYYKPPVGADYADCLQFYERIPLPNSSLPFAGYTGPTNTVYMTVSYTPKRKTPDRVYITPIDSIDIICNGSLTTIDTATINIPSISKSSARISIRGSPFTAANYLPAVVKFDSYSGSMAIDAEF